MRRQLGTDPLQASARHAPDTRLPAGEVTFVFTDIEGSTRLLADVGAERFATLLSTHQTIITKELEQHGGVLFGAQGDALFFAFSDAAGAIEGTLGAQAAMTGHAWAAGEELRIRAGLHTGWARPLGGNYVALAVHQVARICAAAHGRQTIASTVTATAGGISGRELGSFWLKDFEDPVALVQFGEGEFPALKVAAERLRRVALPETSFVGRWKELEELSKLVDTHRLVTVCGPGGVGKTRLALEHAATHPLGVEVAVAELAGARSQTDVLSFVASALEITQSADVTILDALLSRLGRSKAGLLVLDNCEHVLDPVAELVLRILRQAPTIRMVLTSREPLVLDEERVLRLSPLSLPEAAENADDVLTSDAARLLVDRIVARDPSFALTPDSAADVKELCDRLDGMPLAVELAAAEAATMGLRQTLNSVGRGVEPEGGRGRPERHRSVSVALDWSYRLLTAGEQRLWAILSVFVAPFRLEDAVQVALDDATPEERIRSSIAALVNKSVLARVSAADGDRYRVHQSVREFGQAQLQKNGTLEITRDRHARWARDFLDQNYMRQTPPQWHAAFGVNREDMLAAWNHLRSSGDMEEAALLGATLAMHDMLSHRIREGRERFLELVTWPEGPHLARAYLLGASRLSRYIDPDEALAIAERATPYMHLLTSEERGMQADARVFIHMEQLDLDAAEIAIREMVGLERTGYRYEVCIGLFNREYLALCRLDLERSQQLLEEALRSLEGDQSIYMAGICYGFIDIALLSSDIDKARMWTQRLVKEASDCDAGELEAFGRMLAAALGLGDGHLDAISPCRQALESLEEWGIPFTHFEHIAVLKSLAMMEMWPALAVATGAAARTLDDLGRSTPLHDQLLAESEAGFRAALGDDADRWFRLGWDNPTYGEIAAATSA